MWVNEQADHAVFVAVRANGVECSSDFLRNEGVGVKGFFKQLREHSIQLRIQHLSQFVRHIIECYHCILTQVWPQTLDQPDDLRHQQPNQSMIQYIAVVLDDSTKFGQSFRTSLPLLRLYLDQNILQLLLRIMKWLQIWPWIACWKCWVLSWFIVKVFLSVGFNYRFLRSAGLSLFVGLDEGSSVFFFLKTFSFSVCE